MDRSAAVLSWTWTPGLQHPTRLSKRQPLVDLSGARARNYRHQFRREVLRRHPESERTTWQARVVSPDLAIWAHDAALFAAEAENVELRRRVNRLETHMALLMRDRRQARAEQHRLEQVADALDAEMREHGWSLFQEAESAAEEDSEILTELDALPWNEVLGPE